MSDRETVESLLRLLTEVADDDSDVESRAHEALDAFLRLTRRAMPEGCGQCSIRLDLETRLAERGAYQKRAILAEAKLDRLTAAVRAEHHGQEPPFQDACVACNGLGGNATEALHKLVLGEDRVLTCPECHRTNEQNRRHFGMSGHIKVLPCTNPWHG